MLPKRRRAASSLPLPARGAHEMIRGFFGPRRLVAALAASFLIAASVQAVAQAPPTTVPAPRKDGWWQQRHEKYLEDVKKAREGAGVDLIFLGDSITEGWG